MDDISTTMIGLGQLWLVYVQMRVTVEGKNAMNGPSTDLKAIIDFPCTYVGYSYHPHDKLLSDFS